MSLYLAAIPNYHRYTLLNLHPIEVALGDVIFLLSFR